MDMYSNVHAVSCLHRRAPVQESSTGSLSLFDVEVRKKLKIRQVNICNFSKLGSDPYIHSGPGQLPR